MEQPSPTTHTRIAPSATLLLSVGYLAVLFLLDAGNDAVAVLQGRGPAGPLGFLTDALVWWGAWVPVLFLGLTVARRVSPDRIGWLRSGGANFVLSVVLVLIHLFCASLIFDLLSGPDDGRAVVQRMQRLGTIFLMPELLTVWGAAALLYSFSFGLGLKARELEAARLRAAMSEARLEALRREISPHFLFNALNSVGGLIRSGRGHAATDMLDALATLLRRSLEDDHRTEIRLDEELFLLDQYVRVEKARWGDALTVTMDIDEGLESAAVPPLVLQPLVENAIRHGMDGPGTIRVEARASVGRLTLAVLDPASSAPVGGHAGGTSGLGIGLSNTRERLACLHGDSAQLSVRSMSGHGTSVRIEVPLRHVAGQGSLLSLSTPEVLHA